MRRIVQIATSLSDEDGYIYALCDDGTLWRRVETRNAQWDLVEDVPQDPDEPPGRTGRP